ncbi:uncharacterized protein LOC132737528, partial [Ruditapes philippinarum]|uniref:uncharacterized protein LOC132737528 n=1 Tax=Ruditapes philippinarum TaxID=129788 RepID=UPI00295A5869
PPNIDKLKFPTTITPLGPTSYDNVPYTHVNRTKRQVTLTSSKIEPELLLFCDNAMVQQFEGDTDELLEYLLHFWHAVNWKFLTISLQRQWPHIDLKIREIGVFRDPSAQPFIEENRIRRGSRLFSLYDAMDSLQRWLVKYETVLPLHDAAFLQTGWPVCSIKPYKTVSTGQNLDGPEFKKSQQVFQAMVAELKRQGAGGIDHYPPLERQDLLKLYGYFDVSDPENLQEKVFVDIMLHFGRRGRENLRDLCVSDFGMTTDSDGLRYIYLRKDEQTKNHQLDTNTAKGSMYEIKGYDEKCPVRTFIQYKRLLPPGCNYLFPRPLKMPTKDGFYFSLQPLGHNKLGGMMAYLSKKAKLSHSYTNHSLRATAVHILDGAHIPTRHIMTVTGHKAESSLKTYTGYTDHNTKKAMSHTLSKSVGLTVSDSICENSKTVTLDNDGAVSDYKQSERDHLDLTTSTLDPLTNSQFDKFWFSSFCGCVLFSGVAYVRGSCLSAPYFRKLAYNFGIGEASTSFNDVIIAAHEVGHLLGAYHDGEAEARGCASNSGYIMSYSREDAYKFSRFSPCSISSFQNFLNMDRSACLRQRASNEIMKFPTSFPGTYMSINEQCRRFTGGPPCEIGPKQCEHLCCDDAKGQWRYTRSEPAVDGTSCGKRNVCLNGQCISLASFG